MTGPDAAPASAGQPSAHAAAGLPSFRVWQARQLLGRDLLCGCFIFFTYMVRSALLDLPWRGRCCMPGSAAVAAALHTCMAGDPSISTASKHLSTQSLCNRFSAKEIPHTLAAANAGVPVQDSSSALQHGASHRSQPRCTCRKLIRLEQPSVLQPVQYLR